jgi:YcxB-like protein
MNTPFHYQNTYILDKSHFTECYSETAVRDDSFRPYTKAAILLGFALVVMMATEISAYVSYFVFGLGIVEALGVYYRKPWWIYRQLLSKAANNEVTMTIEDNGITIKSAFVSLSFPWQDIEQLQKSALGWLFVHNNVKHYISDRCLSEEAQQFIQDKKADQTDVTIED